LHPSIAQPTQPKDSALVQIQPQADPTITVVAYPTMSRLNLWIFRHQHAPAMLLQLTPNHAYAVTQRRRQILQTLPILPQCWLVPQIQQINLAHAKMSQMQQPKLGTGIVIALNQATISQRSSTSLTLLSALTALTSSSAVLLPPNKLPKWIPLLILQIPHWLAQPIIQINPALARTSLTPHQRHGTMIATAPEVTTRLSRSSTLQTPHSVLTQVVHSIAVSQLLN
jgi:hypothetical protein